MAKKYGKDVGSEMWDVGYGMCDLGERKTFCNFIQHPAFANPG